MSYQSGIPTGTVNLDVDYQNLQNNFQQLDTQFGVDHIPFSNTSGTPPDGVNGYHTSIHFNPASTTSTNPQTNYNSGTASPIGVPTATPGFGQLFSAQVNDGANTDEALFWLSGGNKLIELTRNLVPSIATNGYTMLPGGLILQWGSKTGSSNASVPVTFNISFPFNCFNVNVIPVRSTTSPGSDFSTAIVTASVSKTGFTIANIGAHTISSWYWLAIGN